MSDPFLPLEVKKRSTLEILQVLAKFKYPTVISTKNDLFIQDEYLGVLKAGRFIVQLSISSMDDNLLSKIDVGTPGPSRLLSAARVLRSEGISTACRIQPLLPTREKDAINVIEACVGAGVRHVAVEHLKLPVERSWWGTGRLSTALGVDVESYYATRFATRVGREWILPVQERLDTVLMLRNHAQRRGMTFGAADNDLLLLTDGDCCCSGVDFEPGFSQFFRFNYTEAVRRGIEAERVSVSLLDHVWRPSRSIGEYVNSRSRISATKNGGIGASIKDYIERDWNGSPNGNSPTTLFGVVDTGEHDERGFRLYTVRDEILPLLQSRLKTTS